MSRESRAALARETVSILEAGRYELEDGTTIDLAEGLRECVFETVLYDPEHLDRLLAEARAMPAGKLKTAVSVLNESTLQGARALNEQGHGKIGILNFASAKNPGGGFLNGSQAQEESLARSSGLYASLMTEPDYYEFHRSSGDLLYSHRAIHSPGCPIFRDDAGGLLREPMVADVITCAAPNAGEVARNTPEKLQLLPETLRQRASYVLALAMHHGCMALVLGAWGCGVFRNDPAMVAGIFAELLKERAFKGRFQAVRFSVLDGRTFALFEEGMG